LLTGLLDKNFVQNHFSLFAGWPDVCRFPYVPFRLTWQACFSLRSDDQLFIRVLSTMLEDSSLSTGGAARRHVHQNRTDKHAQ
jgi:hypothetical protein